MVYGGKDNSYLKLPSKIEIYYRDTQWLSKKPQNNILRNNKFVCMAYFVNLTETQ